MAEKTTSIAYVSTFKSFKELIDADSDNASLPRMLKNVKVINRGAGGCMIKSTGSPTIPTVSVGLSLDEFGGQLDNWTFDEVDTATTFIKRLSVNGTLEIVFSS